MRLFKKNVSDCAAASYSDSLLDESIQKAMVKSDWIISVFTPIFIIGFPLLYILVAKNIPILMSESVFTAACIAMLVGSILLTIKIQSIYENFCLCKGSAKWLQSTLFISTISTVYMYRTKRSKHYIVKFHDDNGRTQKNEVYVTKYEHLLEWKNSNNKLVIVLKCPKWHGRGFNYEVFHPAYFENLSCIETPDEVKELISYIQEKHLA